MTKIIGTMKNGNNIYSTEFKISVVEEFEKLPDTIVGRLGRKEGGYKVAKKHGISLSLIYKWKKSIERSVTKNPAKSTTSIYQGGATVKPKREQYQMVLDKIEKKLKEVQLLKEEAIQLIKDM